jgi:hypothetical protein
VPAPYPHPPIDVDSASETPKVPPYQKELVKGAIRKMIDHGRSMRKKLFILVILAGTIVWLFSLWALAWVYDGGATGYTSVACAGASPDNRPIQCDTNISLTNDAYILWGVSWLVMAIGAIFYKKLSDRVTPDSSPDKPVRISLYHAVRCSIQRRTG